MPVALVRQAVDAPWKAANELQRYLTLPYIRLYFALMGVPWNKHWRIFGRPVIQRQRGSRICIGTSLQMRNWFGSNPLGVNHPCLLATRSSEAVIHIGNYVGLTGTTICAETAIYIGDRVRFGANCSVVDTDFHPLDPGWRLVKPTEGATAAVVVEDDVFVGMSTLILKGSHIGRGTVVGAGSVVAGEIPPNVIVAGNPARIVRAIET